MTTESSSIPITIATDEVTTTTSGTPEVISVKDGGITSAKIENKSLNLFVAYAGETITAGKVVYILKNTGEARISDTGTADDIRASGIALNSGISEADITVLLEGNYTTTGLTPYATYYLGSAGAISTNVSGVEVGYATSATNLYVKIKQDDKDAVGTVKPYLKSLTGVPANNFTAFWVECNGQVLSDAESPLNTQTIPDLNGSAGTERFLRGQTTSGGTGGTETHSHEVSGGDTGITAVGGTGYGATIVSGSTARVTTPTSAVSTLPSYYEVVFIIKIK
jgi:hypothetical protein